MAVERAAAPLLALRPILSPYAALRGEEREGAFRTDIDVNVNSNYLACAFLDSREPPKGSFVALRAILLWISGCTSSSD